MKRIILLLTAVFSMLFMNSCFTTSSIFGKEDQKAGNSVEEQLSNEETTSEENVSFSTEENEEYLRSVAERPLYQTSGKFFKSFLNFQM